MYSNKSYSVFSSSQKMRSSVVCCVLFLVCLQALVPKGYMLGDLSDGEGFIVVCSVNGIEKIPVSGIQVEYSVEQLSAEDGPLSGQHADEFCALSSLTSVVFTAIDVYKDYYLSQSSQFFRPDIQLLVLAPNYLFPVTRGPPQLCA